MFLVSCIFATSSTALSDPKFNITNVIKQYVVAEYPEWKDLDVKVSFKSDDKLFKGLTALKGSVDYKILEVYKDFKPVGNVIFPIVVKAKGFNKKIFVRAKVEVYKMVVVAQETIPRGQVLNNDSLSLEQRDIAMLPQKFYSQVEDVMLTEAKTSIPKNSTIFAWMVKEVPLVRRGDELMVIVKGTNLLVKRLGKALEDGYLNQAIRIKMDNSKNPIEGVLISTDEVVVKI
ncbi:MAG: flagellar basal body P-ring formation chaperone FlgA [Candidatus Margulisbacteria bacterium]|nr:flagellar basal body P-ring formation chaperone FlgA [Candidatus Margulisiibacteriota bacterium]